MKPETIVIEKNESEYKPTTDKLTAEEAENSQHVKSFDKAMAQGRQCIIESLMAGTSAGINYIVAVVAPSDLPPEELAKRSEDEIKNISQVKKAVISIGGSSLETYLLLNNVKEQIIADNPKLAMFEKFQHLKDMMSNKINPFNMMERMTLLSDLFDNYDDDGNEIGKPAEKTEE